MSVLDPAVLRTVQQHPQVVLPVAQIAVAQSHAARHDPKMLLVKTANAAAQGEPRAAAV